MSIKLSEVLNNRNYADVLYRFTRSNFSNENFEFLYCVRQLNPTKGTCFYTLIPPDKTTISDKALYIYNRFIAASPSPTSRRVQVNINHGTKSQLDTAAAIGNWQINSFDAAYDEVFTMIINDTWPKFAKSKEVNDSNNLRGYAGQFVTETGMRV